MELTKEDFEQGYNYFIKNGDRQIPLYTIKAVRAAIFSMCYIHRTNEKDILETYSYNESRFVS